MSAEGSLIEEECIAFIVPRNLVKTVKDALEKRHKVHTRAKIRPYPLHPDSFASSSPSLIPSSFTVNDEESSGWDDASAFVGEVGLQSEIALTTVRLPIPIKEPVQQSLLEKAAHDWLQSPQSQQRIPQTISSALLEDLPRLYSLYGKFLLLPPQSLDTPQWRSACLSPAENQDLLTFICKRLKVTHIAINAPIPLLKALPSSEDDKNILRSPTNLEPLYGDFGPVCTSDKPSPVDFDCAFWASAKQNGITQCWAPRYTMFSRGNVTEKARILHLPSIQRAIEEGKASGTRCTAVDLYAGIGYFAFSYAAAGVDKVLCWDLNAWSIEGLRQGAMANRWPVTVYDEERQSASLVRSAQESRLLAFVESNERAADRVDLLRRHVPPVRHVNCGLLPTSRHSWKIAVHVLDQVLGGWIHVHENFAIGEIEAKAEWVRQEFQRLMRDKCLMDCHRGRQEEGSPRVVVEHIQRVKSYAPGVWHCVVDLYIAPAPS